MSSQYGHNTYDVIVVGGGSAGSVLTARLTEDPDIRVLLIEAGSGVPLPEMACPPLWPTLARTSAGWGDLTVPQRGAATVPAMPRGKGLGGSSSINAMLFARGHRSSYQRWIDAGAAGWGFDDLLPYFRRTETAVGKNRDLRGGAGPLRVRPADPVSPVLAAALDGAIEVGERRAVDISGGLEEGFGPVDLNIVDGRRQSAADAYLRPVQFRDNLTIVTEALVHSLCITNGRATGVRYLANSELVTASSAEVVLCAGAIGSPQLLMLSGIGPGEHLRKHGIQVVQDLPGVGANLQDHPVGNIVYRSARAIPEPRFNHGEVIGLTRSQPTLESPDLQLIFVDLPRPVTTFDPPDRGFTIGVSVALPHSHGTVRLSDARPGSPPLIDPRYFEDARDLDAMVHGLRLARRIGQSRALADWVDTEAIPGPTAISDADLRQFARRTIASYCHPVGTASIGDHPQSVVDASLRVHGLDGLRVADGSVMPTVPSGNTNATVYAIAERAAEFVRGSTPRF